MRRFGCGYVIGSMLLVACGSNGLGSVQGHDVSGQAIYLSSGDSSNEVYLVVGGLGNLCDVFTGKGRPSGGYSMLETIFVSWNGTSTDPLVPGTYVQSLSAPPGPGLFSHSLAQWGSGCVAYGSLQPGSGSIRIESFGGIQTGAYLVAEVDLKFGDDHLSGHIDAVYCGAIQHVCGP